MNLFGSQNVQTMSELMDLAAVPFHILAPRQGEPMVEIVQDSMTGSFRLTKEWTRINDKAMANLQMLNSYFQGALPAPADEKNHLYSGVQAYSQILPPGLFINLKNKQEEKFAIYNSQITSGSLDKDVFSSQSTGMLSVIYHDYSPFEVRRFIDNTQRLICSWLTTAGFSVGISDLVVDKVNEGIIKQTISKFKGNAYEAIDKMRTGQLENESIFSNEDFFERKILNILNDCNKQVGKIATKEINPRTNRMINMIKSGAKGKPINIAQMIACVGQQNVDGKRVGYGFTDRTLPHYAKYDDGPEARGFVENSFISGLTPQEVFFHAMGGRDGLIDTAVKTSDTGYTQRKLVKAMEDCKIYYDQTVRNATGAIVQFVYGEDGIDGTKVEKQRVPYIKMNLVEMDAIFHLRPEDPFNIHITTEAMEEMRASSLKDSKSEDSLFVRCTEHYKQLTADRHFLITKIFKGEGSSGSEYAIEYAIPFERIIHTSLERIKCISTNKVSRQTDLTPDIVLDAIDDLCKRLKIVREGQGVHFLHILLRFYLSPKPLIFDRHMTKETFNYIVTEIERYFVNGVAQAGEMVGIVAAQSIGELGTQQTLDSFHSSGTAAAVQATSGVPRLKELLSVSKNIKTPTLLIYMKPDISAVVNPPLDEDGAVITDVIKGDDGTILEDRMAKAMNRSIKVMNQFEITRLVDILDRTDIYWDPAGESGLNTNIENDDGMMSIYKAFTRADHITTHSKSPWVLRLKINKEKLHRIKMTMMDIYIKLNTYNQTIECLYSDDNSPELLFRIRMTSEVVGDLNQDDAISALKAIEFNVTNNILLKGVKGIKKVSMRCTQREVYNKKTDKFNKVAEWVLDTDGTNLQKLLGDPNVDSVRTRSNDIYEIYLVLGVEAARNAMNLEFMEVLGKDKINYRHMSLLLDTMTNRGNLMSVDRHGINRGDVGPLAKSSFEETTDMLINASVFSEYDHINGVSANIMLGQMVPAGTGDHDVMLDEDEYIKIMSTLPKRIKRGLTFSAEEEDAVNEAQLYQEGCSVDNLMFHFKLPEKNESTIRNLAPQAVTFV